MYFNPNQKKKKKSSDFRISQPVEKLRRSPFSAVIDDNSKHVKFGFS